MGDVIIDVERAYGHALEPCRLHMQVLSKLIVSSKGEVLCNRSEADKGVGNCREGKIQKSARAAMNW